VHIRSEYSIEMNKRRGNISDDPERMRVVCIALWSVPYSVKICELNSGLGSQLGHVGLGLSASWLVRVAVWGGWEHSSWYVPPFECTRRMSMRARE